MATSTSQSFWHSINILHRKPHVVNKRIWGSKTWLRLACKPLEPQYWGLPLKLKRVDQIVTKENIDTYTQIILQELELQVCNKECKAYPIEVILTEVFAKRYSEIQMFQLIVIQQYKASVTYFDITKENFKQNLFPEFTYTFQLKRNEVVLKADTDSNSPSYLWLKNTLLSQIVKWREDSVNSSEVICKESLALVSQQKYYAKYNELKLKYGKEMVKIWPECTDPSKFVYEDVAIATYLLLLWEEDERAQTKKYTFADLGCGNGLLVYILAKEGYSGVGIDIRKRNIWDLYPPEVKLEVKTIVPSDSSLFPETAWIIGNHSDELTPWIPVIAAKSSYDCNFFLLPCCAYNFDGTKYQRKDSSKSQYIDYLGHIKELSVECGFKVDIDRLKIPSTKRICLVSKGRTYSMNNYDEYCYKIHEIIERCSTSTMNQNDSWLKDFKARESYERVRNCTQKDKNLINSIVKCIADYLLVGSDETCDWYAGKTVELSKLIHLIPQDQLKQLKFECGGIQTLLKNKHNIFKVQGGKVQLRYPVTVEEVNRKSKAGNLKIKQKPCWFYNNHPQGCPLPDINCSFLHIRLEKN